MKIAIASDLHLEIGDLDLTNTNNADVLVLAGDILVAEDLHNHARIPPVPYTPEELKTLGPRQLKAHTYREFIYRISKEFPHVVVIAGNHEFYNGRWIQSLKTLTEEYSAYYNVHFLEDNSVKINDVVFVGGTLWTDMNNCDPLTQYAITGMMNDYKVIRHDGLGFTKLRPAHTISRHRKTLEYFKNKIAEHPNDKIIVVSHMAPTSQSVHPQYQNAKTMNGAYYTNLSEFILDNPQIKLWCHGHMHNESDYMVGTTRVICNPRGYVGYERGLQTEEPYLAKIVEI